MPSAKEKFGDIFGNSNKFENSDFFGNLHRLRTSHNIVDDDEEAATTVVVEAAPTASAVDVNATAAVANPVVVHVEPEEVEEAYSDFTEKLQSLYPECKLFSSKVKKVIPRLHVKVDCM